MHNASKELKDSLIENLRGSLEMAENTIVIIADIEVYSSSQPDIIESTTVRAIQDYDRIDFIRIFDVEYNKDKDTLMLWYADIENEVLEKANIEFGIKEEDKYDLLFELGLESLSDFSEKPFAFMFDSEVKASETILGI